MTFVHWALPCLGCTLIITCSTLLYPFRVWMLKRHRKLGELAVCPMCVGFWVGVVASALGLSMLDPMAYGTHHPALLLFGDGLASAWVNWAAYITLCALGQGKHTSTRKDLLYLASGGE